MKRSTATFSLLTLALASQIGCPGKLSQAEWESYEKELRQEFPDPLPPQYDNGTVALTDPNNNNSLGTVYIWLNQAGTAYVEGFEILNMADYATKKVKVEEAYDTPQRGSDTDFTLAEFDALVSSSVCTSSDSTCVAKREYLFQAFPSSLAPAQGWDRKVVAVDQFVDVNCPSTATNAGKSAFVYRDRVKVGGTNQVKWVEHWFVRTSVPSPDFGKFQAPDLCQDPNGQNDHYYRLELGAPVAAPLNIDTFREQLLGNTSACGSPKVAWCGFCGSNGAACNHAPVVLNWNKRNNNP